MDSIKRAKLRLVTRLIDKLIESSVCDGTLNKSYYCTNKDGERVLTPEGETVINELRQCNDELKEIAKSGEDDELVGL